MKLCGITGHIFWIISPPISWNDTKMCGSSIRSHTVPADHFHALHGTPRNLFFQSCLNFVGRLNTLPDVLDKHFMLGNYEGLVSAYQYVITPKFLQSLDNSNGHCQSITWTTIVPMSCRTLSCCHLSFSLQKGFGTRLVCAVTVLLLNIGGLNHLGLPIHVAYFNGIKKFV